MLRARTRNHLPRFRRGGVYFSRGWLTLTEPGDPLVEGESPDLTKAQAKAVRGEKRFLEVETIPQKEAAKILSPQGKPAANSSPGGSQGKDTPPKGDDPSGKAPAGGESTEKNPGSDDPQGDGAKPRGEGPVDLNSATKAELEAVGLSAKAAGAVVGYRKKITKDGKRFESVDQLTEVHGIGDETLAALRDSLNV